MTQEPRGSGPDLVGDFQRWLIRSGARGMSRELGGQIRSAFGRGGQTADVWETATADPPEEAPECAWCPVCRAARMLRESGPGLATHVTTAGDVLSTIVTDAVAVVESALAGAARPAGSGPGTESATPAGTSLRGTAPVAGTAVGESPVPDAAGRGDVWAQAQFPAGDASEHTGPPGSDPHGPDDRG